MLGAILEGLGKMECSEYRLYRTGFCFGAASRREGHQRPWEGDLVSRPGSAAVSPGLLGPQFLCETGVLVYIECLPAPVILGFLDLVVLVGWG